MNDFSTGPNQDNAALRVAAWVQPEIIRLDADAKDRAHALELAATAAAHLLGVDPVPMLRALWRREQVGSTALGDGVAIPHARIGGISRPLTVFMRTRRPLPFDAPDGGPVSQVLTILVPRDGARDDHLQLLALIARLFSQRSFRTQLAEAGHVTAAAEAFRSGIARVLAGVGAGG